MPLFCFKKGRAFVFFFYQNGREENMKKVLTVGLLLLILFGVFFNTLTSGLCRRRSTGQRNTNGNKA